MKRSHNDFEEIADLLVQQLRAVAAGDKEAMPAASIKVVADILEKSGIRLDPIKPPETSILKDIPAFDEDEATF